MESETLEKALRIRQLMEENEAKVRNIDLLLKEGADLSFKVSAKTKEMTRFPGKGEHGGFLRPHHESYSLLRAFLICERERFEKFRSNLQEQLNKL